MKGSLSHEMDVALPPGELWEVYSSLRLGELVAELLPHIIAKVEVEQGDGGVGTVLRLTLPPEFPGSGFYKEKLVKIDHEQRIIEATVVEGGFLEAGFTSYLVRFQIVGNVDSSSTIKSTIEYEIEEEHAANASLVSTAPPAAIGEAISKYLLDQKKTTIGAN